MKVIALTAALALASTSAFAGNMDAMVMDAAPAVEAPMMEAPSGGSMSGLGWLIPLVAIAAIVATQD